MGYQQYRWVGEYHNQKLAEQPPVIADLAVPRDLMTRRFSPIKGRVS